MTSVSPGSTSVADHWELMVSTALLGTDRRDPPASLVGPFADLESDLPQSTPSSRLIQQVAAVAVARRAGVMPGAPVALLDPPAADPRPVTPPPATFTWQRITAHWPVLEDEWLLTLVSNGWRTSPELAVPLLSRHRGDATRHARVRLAVGSLASWLIDLSPRLGCASRQQPAAESVASLPELAIVPDLVPLLSAGPAVVARSVGAAVENGSFTNAHKGVLVNFVARVHPQTLSALAQAFDRVHSDSPSKGLAFALADLAHLRHRALSELAPADPSHHHPESP